jgi:FkbM family methyltransferase
VLISSRVIGFALRNQRGLPCVHVGAHRAEEQSLYEELRSSHTYWFEAQSSLCRELEVRLDSQNNTVICGAVWSQSGQEHTLNIASNSQSSSLLELKLHSREHPEVVYVDSETVSTLRLDEVLPDENLGLLNLDVQGAELHALIGLGRRINKVGAIYSEVNATELYAGCAQIEELDDFLFNAGFERILSKWSRHGWGDALYLRRKSLNPADRFLIRSLFWLDEVKVTLSARRWLRRAKRRLSALARLSKLGPSQEG